VPDDGSIDWDSAAPAIVCTFPTADNGSPINEMWYWAPGIGIGVIWWRADKMTGAITSDPNYNVHLGVSSDPQASIYVAAPPGDFAGVLPYAGYFDPGPVYDFGWCQFSWDQTIKTENLSEQVKFWDLCVYDNSGITRRGTDPQGVWASDVIKYLLSMWAPMVGYTASTIDDTSSFIIPHLEFREATTVSEGIKQAMRFHTNDFDWAVWNGRLLYIKPKNSGRKWRARSGPAQLEQAGQQIERVWNGIFVQFTDGAGTTVRVGPPGSGADVTSSMLLDTDPDNPANVAGINRWDQLNIGYSTPAGAIQIGAEFLAESKQLDQSGNATLTGYVEDESGILRPYSHVHADDTISFIDAADTSFRRISSTNKNDTSKSCGITIDSPPEGLQALLERLDAALVRLGFGNG